MPIANLDSLGGDDLTLHALNTAAEHLSLSRGRPDFLSAGEDLKLFLDTNNKVRKGKVLDAITAKLIEETRETAATERAVQQLVGDEDLARALSLSRSDAAASAVRRAAERAEPEALVDAMLASEASYALESQSRDLQDETSESAFLDKTVEFDLAARAYKLAQQSDDDHNLALAVCASLSSIQDGMSVMGLADSPEDEIERYVTFDPARG
jgi:hypothetical protein